MYKEEKLNADTPLIAGTNIYYKCIICNEKIASLPYGGSCKCRNIRIDADACRIAINDYENALVVSPKLENKNTSKSRNLAFLWVLTLTFIVVLLVFWAIYY